MLSSGSRCQAPGKLQLQKTSGNHRPQAERGTNLGSSEEQQDTAQRLIHPERGHCPGGTSGAPWNSPAPASFCRGLGARMGPTSGWLGGDSEHGPWRLERLQSDPPCSVTWGLWPHLSEPCFSICWMRACWECLTSPGYLSPSSSMGEWGSEMGSDMLRVTWRPRG